MFEFFILYLSFVSYNCHFVSLSDTHKAPATTGLFGAPAPAAGGLFGAPSPGKNYEQTSVE